MRSPIILGVGGAHIDRRGQVAGDFVPGASNPGAMGEDVGGGTFNALRTAVQRGATGWMMSVRGGDAAGATVARAIADAGIRDLSVTFLDRGTPSYTAILSRDGDVLAALADMGLYDLAFPKQMRRSSLRAAAGGADAILCDANLPAVRAGAVAGAGVGQAGLRDRDLACQGGSAGRHPAPPRLPLPQHARGSRPDGSRGRRAAGRDGRRAARPGPQERGGDAGDERVIAFDADGALTFTPPRGQEPSWT